MTRPRIRTALAGVGNCASALVQGVFHCRQNPSVGVMTADIGGRGPGDIEFAAAFDVDRRKVGRDLSQAIFAPPNCTPRLVSDVPWLDCPVEAGLLLDGAAPHMLLSEESRSFRPVDLAEDGDRARQRVIARLVSSHTEVLVNFCPVGSEEASRFYADCALRAGVAFINAIPVPLTGEFGPRFFEAGLPLLGDDIKSQVGATIVHQALCRLFEERGQRIRRTYQLNVGGNTDFLNMMDRSRLGAKKKSKTEAVTSQFPGHVPPEVHVSPTDYVPFLGDTKVCFIRIEAEQFGGLEAVLDLRMEVVDSPNSAGVVVDAIRAARLARDRGLGGPIPEAAGYLFKSPPVPYTEEQARQAYLEFIGGGAHHAGDRG